MGTTRTRSPRTPGQATPTVTYRTKSDHVRALLDQGMSVAEITRVVPGMGYAFAYGIAKRYGKAATAATRRKTAAVKIDPDSGIVTIRTDVGTVITVDRATGKVRTTKS
jgi:hypothetical protein